ncbi:YtxH domain-containing protein [Mucilaginibacter achroorhodeus]|uniref:YtxH domain-containing protein n=1 Tax=Mucilaginibacter achroorhodeus TaxID=2599294 RepID=A0A563TZF6_9SPHI|nr:MULTISPECIES: YtxH domain-containing protein [Mucilaginibacter]QXV65381.1 YtxH domain-containing protein [Mucilaginibacter sp. 21P]TWR24510.1 YtxH domain-containing protein [Mucilaginibacter achroorhodeus]
MGLIRFIAIGAAVGLGVNYLMKKRDEDGRSVLDDLREKAPEWFDKAKEFAADKVDMAAEKVRSYNG